MASLSEQYCVKTIFDGRTAHERFVVPFDCSCVFVVRYHRATVNVFIE